MIQVLTIAGSDSGAGAGIQADLKTFHAHGVYGTTVVTAVTAQNTQEIAVVADVPVEIVEAQLTAVLEDFDIAAIKTGMLATAETVHTVVRVLEKYAHLKLVVDPVSTASTGATLADEETVSVMRDKLLPLAFAVTPNVSEAETLSGIDITSNPDLEVAARRIHELGCAHVIITGGHADFDRGTDVLFDGADFHRFKGEWIEGAHTHGSGCTFSAALTARLAKGDPIKDAVAAAKRYTTRAIANAPGIGRGESPTNHFFFWTGDEPNG